jgi:hypothetical protein
LQVAQRLAIQLHSDLGGAGSRAGYVIGFSEGDIFCDDSLVEAPAQAGKLEVDSLGAQLFEHWVLEEPGQPDLVKVEDAPKQKKADEPHQHPEAAEADPAQTQEAVFANRRGFVRVCHS